MGDSVMKKLLFCLVVLTTIPLMGLVAQDLGMNHQRGFPKLAHAVRDIVREEGTRPDSFRFSPRRNVQHKSVLGGMVLQSIITQNWDTATSAWVNFSYSTYSYDSLGNSTKWLYQTWDGSVWVNSSLSTWSMDEQGRIATWLYQSWDWGANGFMWLNYQLTTYSYGANGYDEVELEQEWSDTGWANYGRSTYSYDTNGFFVSLVGQAWSSTGWVNGYQYTGEHDSNGKYTSELIASWDGNSWVNTERVMYSYDVNGHDSTDLWQYWSDSVWTNGSLDTYSFDGRGYDTGKMDQSWNGSGWENYWLATMTYDPDGNETQYVLQMWDGSRWVDNWRKLSTWELLTPVQDNKLRPLRYSLSPNYPNPFNPSTQIRFTLPQAADVTVKIYNILGEQIATLADELQQPGEHTIIWNASSIPSGVYFYRLTAGRFIKTKKMVLMK